MPAEGIVSIDGHEEGETCMGGLLSLDAALGGVSGGGRNVPPIVLVVT